MGRPGSVDDEKQVALYVFCNDEKGSGENDGLGRFFFCGENDVLCFFAVIRAAGDYSILPIYRACRDARRRVETGSFLRDERGAWGASPPHSRVHAQQILRIPATGCPAA